MFKKKRRKRRNIRFTVKMYASYCKISVKKGMGHDCRLLLSWGFERTGRIFSEKHSSVKLFRDFFDWDWTV